MFNPSQNGQPLTLVADCNNGCLRVSHAIQEITEELQFTYRSFVQDDIGPPVPIGNGKIFQRKGKRRINIETRPMYALTEQGGLTTHNGLYTRIANKLKSLGIRFEYFHDGAWATPVINPSVARGLDPDQLNGLAALLSACQHGGALANAATGSGKTRLIAGLIRAFRHCNVLVATHSVAVVRSLHKNLTELLAEDGIELGMCHGTHKEPRPITVSTLGTIELAMDADVCDVLIVDEVHTTCGDAASGKILQYNKSLRFGLSGTIEKRFDGKESQLEALYGPIVYTFSDQAAEASGRVCPIKAYFLSVNDGPELESRSDAYRERHGLWRNAYRNQLARRVVDLAPADQQLLIFVRTVEHLKVLKAGLFSEFEVCHADLSSKEREAVEEGFVDGSIKRLISTDCMSTGVDPKNLWIMMDMSAIKGDSSMAQKRGRLRRWAPGKTYGVLVQFLDDWSEKLHRKALSRVKDLRERGDEVLVGCRPEDIRFVELGPEAYMTEPQERFAA